MHSTLNHLNARRAWLVRDISIWGSISAESLDSVATEIDDTQTRVVYNGFTIGGQSQELIFAALIDHRGNSLPATIDAPAIIPIAKSNIPVAVIGQPTPASCRLAKSFSTPDDAIVDLWIIEARS